MKAVTAFSLHTVSLTPDNISLTAPLFCSSFRGWRRASRLLTRPCGVTLLADAMPSLEMRNINKESLWSRETEVWFKWASGVWRTATGSAVSEKIIPDQPRSYRTADEDSRALRAVSKIKIHWKDASFSPDADLQTDLKTYLLRGNHYAEAKTC